MYTSVTETEIEYNVKITVRIGEASIDVHPQHIYLPTNQKDLKKGIEDKLRKEQSEFCQENFCTEYILPWEL